MANSPRDCVCGANDWSDTLEDPPGGTFYMCRECFDEVFVPETPEEPEDG